TTAAAVSSHEVSMARMRPAPGIDLVYRPWVRQLAPALPPARLQATLSLPETTTAGRRETIKDMEPASRQFDAALRIVRELQAAGYEAYLAGGCVRDLLLGREPTDYDVATAATPDVVLGLFPRTFAVGAHFGVVLVADGDEAGYVTTEVATFRSDGAYSDGRHPDAVRYTRSAEEDVQRRDFTINGLLLDPLKLRDA